jgi:hypothetical protein
MGIVIRKTHRELQLNNHYEKGVESEGYDL